MELIVVGDARSTVCPRLRMRPEGLFSHCLAQIYSHVCAITKSNLSNTTHEDHRNSSYEEWRGRKALSLSEKRRTDFKKNDHKEQ